VRIDPETGKAPPDWKTALLVLLAGYFLAKQIEKWVDGVLKRMDFNRMAREGGLAEAVDRARPYMEPVNAIGKLMFWLVMLVVTVAVPLGLDAAGRLTYFTSLALWGIPILYLWPVFNSITANGTGRRRRALRHRSSSPSSGGAASSSSSGGAGSLSPSFLSGAARLTSTIRAR